MAKSTSVAAVRVRAATAADAAASVCVLRRSIRQLCVADHQNDAETLALWLRNKTAERFRSWLDQPQARLLVAEREQRLRGVGMIHASGEIRLCYVEPGFDRSGIGSALLRGLEAQARAWRCDAIRLKSSVTARGFYERHGYASTGSAVPGSGVTMGYPYEKTLRP